MNRLSFLQEIIWSTKLHNNRIFLSLNLHNPNQIPVDEEKTLSLLGQKDETELVKKVFNSQKNFSVKNDWVLQVQSDLDECDVQLSETEISKMKRCSFTKLINEQINQIAAQYLIGLR